MPDFDTLRQAQQWFVSTKARGTLPFIDFSRVSHGITIAALHDPESPAPDWESVQEAVRLGLQSEL